MPVPTQLKVECNFIGDGTTWVDISAYVLPGLKTHRGRNFELDAIETGTCVIPLENIDRRFDPSNNNFSVINYYQNPRLTNASGGWANGDQNGANGFTSITHNGTGGALSGGMLGLIGPASTTKYMHFTNTDGSTIQLNNITAYGNQIQQAVVPTQINVSAYAIATDSPTNITVWLQLFAYDASMTFVTSSAGTSFSVSSSFPVRCQNTLTGIPSNVVYVKPVLRVVGSTTDANAQISNIMLTPNTSTALPYQDPFGGADRWLGQVENSWTINGGSPYSPWVIPNRPVRVSVTYAGRTYYVYTGYIQDWPQAYEGIGYAHADVNSSDGFEALAQAAITGSFSSELTGARIGHVLDSAGWSGSARSISAGNTTVDSITYVAADQQMALQHIQDVADTELGLFFIDASGNAVFQDRHYRLTSTRSRGTLATFGDAPGVGIPDVATVNAMSNPFFTPAVTDWNLYTSAGSVSAVSDTTFSIGPTPGLPHGVASGIKVTTTIGGAGGSNQVYKNTDANGSDAVFLRNGETAYLKGYFLYSSGTGTPLFTLGARVFDLTGALVNQVTISSVTVGTGVWQFLSGTYTATADCYVNAEFTAANLPATTAIWKATAAQATSLATELEYIELSPSFDTQHLYNDWTVSPSDGSTAQQASDTSSVNKYWRRSNSRGALTSDAGECLAQAQWLVFTYKEPKQRFDSMKFMPIQSDTLWLHALGREISDRVTVVRRPVNTNANPWAFSEADYPINNQQLVSPVQTAIKQDCYIEAIDIEFDSNWEETIVTWQLSPVLDNPVTGNSFWILDDGTAGRLDYNHVGY